MAKRAKANPWKGLVVGALGGVAGVLAMSAYWQAVNKLLGYDPRKAGDPTPQPQPLDSISLIGKHHQDGESSTAALGRILYQALAGKEPSEETRQTLSYLVHWGISMGMSGLYGALRQPASAPDISGGLALGTGLWLLGDEVAMPLLGLTKGPTAYPSELHLHSWAAHLAYGLASSTAAQVLDEIL